MNIRQHKAFFARTAKSNDVTSIIPGAGDKAPYSLWHKMVYICCQAPLCLSFALNPRAAGTRDVKA